MYIFSEDVTTLEAAEVFVHELSVISGGPEGTGLGFRDDVCKFRILS
jgi:hypothetical protein